MISWYKLGAIADVANVYPHTLVQKKIKTFSETQMQEFVKLITHKPWIQGSNYTKVMEAIASVPFDLALMPLNIKALLCMKLPQVPLCTGLDALQYSKL